MVSLSNLMPRTWLVISLEKAGLFEYYSIFNCIMQRPIFWLFSKRIYFSTFTVYEDEKSINLKQHLCLLFNIFQSQRPPNFPYFLIFFFSFHPNSRLTKATFFSAAHFFFAQSQKKMPHFLSRSHAAVYHNISGETYWGIYLFFSGYTTWRYTVPLWG